jgi:glycosyltransferase involved in cell wall biosynthesis
VVDRLMRYLYAKAERIIMLSKHSTELLVEGGADASKIVWIPQGVDLHMSPQPKPAPVDGKFTVTYLGAHNKWNSLDTVLDAAKILRDTGNKDILFRFVGAGVSKPELMKRAHDEGLDNVRFDDPVGKNMVCQVQHNSNAFIINNRKDGVSKRWMSFNKLFDYLCAGRPVVFGSYTDNDPVRESGAGISVEAGNAPALADAVRFLSRQSPRQLFEYGMAGRRFVEANYSIPVLIDRFEAMACEITGLPAGSANERA